MASSTLPKAALWMQNVNYPASHDRTLIDVLFQSEGVVSGFAVTPVSGLTISVSAGQAVIAGDEVANQGKYLVDSDAAVELTLGSVGSNRTEYVYLAINDAAVAGGRAGNNVTIETSTSLPANSVLLLATLTLTTGTSTITAGMIADDRVYADQIPTNSITTAKLVDDAVTQAKIGPAAVGTNELADDAVTQAKIGVAAVGTTELTDNAVTTAKIAAGAVDTTDIADDAVTQAKIAASAVGTTELADNAVTTAKIAVGAVGTTDIADDAVTDAKTGAPTTGSLDGGKIRYARMGNIVHVWTTTATTQAPVGPLPSGFRPAANVIADCYNVNDGTGGYVTIETNGYITCYRSSGTPVSGRLSVSFSTV